MEKQVTNKVKGLIKDEVCMGTYGLVELEVRELEQIKDDLLEALIELVKKYEFNMNSTQRANIELDEEYIESINAINKATK